MAKTTLFTPLHYVPTCNGNGNGISWFDQVLAPSIDNFQVRHCRFRIRRYTPQALPSLTTYDIYTVVSPFLTLFRHEHDNDVDKAVNGGYTSDSFEQTRVQANAQLEKEEFDLEKAIFVIIDVQMKNIHDKLVRFEDLDLLLEKECQQVEQMKNMLYVDKLTLLFHRRSMPKAGEHMERNKG